jgi:hypothetical protein
MNIKRTTALVAVLGTLALAANAQDNTPPAGGPPGADSQHPGMREGGRPPGPQGFHLLPPRAAERLNLTDDQKQQITALEAETKAKLEKILTPEQLEQLKNMRPPMRPGGPGGQGHHGPRNGPGGDGNDAPSGPPPADN